MDKIYYLIIAIVLAIIIFILWVYFKNLDKKRRALIIQSILEAEERFKDPKQGKVKLTWVSNKVYAIFPLAFRLYFTEQDMEALVQSVYDSVKNILKKEVDKCLSQDI